MDIDRNGVVWVALASGHLASFDRRKCKGPLNGPTATGQHCPRGVDVLRRAAARNCKGVTESGQRRSAATTPGWTSSTRSAWARNMPINTGNESDGLLALKDGKWVDAARAVSARLLHQVAGRPHRRSERRLEGPRAVGHVSTRAPFHMEGGKGTTSKVMQVPAAARSAGEVIPPRIQRSSAVFLTRWYPPVHA